MRGGSGALRFVPVALGAGGDLLPRGDEADGKCTVIGDGATVAAHVRDEVTLSVRVGDGVSMATGELSSETSVENRVRAATKTTSVVVPCTQEVGATEGVGGLEVGEVARSSGGPLSGRGEPTIVATEAAAIPADREVENSNKA
jgi:hypothetical protein